MAGGWPRVGSGNDIADEIGKIWRAIRELSKPAGTAIASLVKQVQTQLATIDTRVDAAVQTAVGLYSMTADAVRDLVANPGTINASGIATLNAGIISADVHGRILSTGYDAVYVGDGDRLGISPSARRFKQDVQPAAFDSSLIDLIEPVQFRLIGAVEKLGDAAKVEVGFIAEQLEEIGYSKFVSYDADGQTTGIAYERLCVPLVAGLQDARAQIRALTSRLDAAGL